MMSLSLVQALRNKRGHQDLASLSLFPMSQSTSIYVDDIVLAPVPRRPSLLERVSEPSHIFLPVGDRIIQGSELLDYLHFPEATTWSKGFLAALLGAKDIKEGIIQVTTTSSMYSVLV